jgi:quercetin dioxygenase-like cupin family protein
MRLTMPVVGRSDLPVAIRTVLEARNLTDAPGYKLVLLNVHYGPGACTSDHAHPGEKTLLVQSGELSVSLHGEAHTHQAGSAVLIPTDVLHSIRNLSGAPADALEVLIVEKDAPLWRVTGDRQRNRTETVTVTT